MSNTPSIKDSQSKKPRRRFALSLRALMLLILAAGGASGWFAYRARVQREAVKAITRAGGFVQYDYRYAHGEYRANKKSWVPPRLLRALGEDFFHDVTYVSLPFVRVRRLANRLSRRRAAQVAPAAAKPSASPAGRFAALAALGQVQQLSAFMSDLTNDDLSHVEGLSHLRDLDLRGTKVTDAGMVHVQGLSGLHELKLSNTTVGDVGLSRLAGLRQLRSLDLRGTMITDAGLVHLVNMPELETLDLSGTKITDGGLRLIDSLKRLQSLRIGRTKATGAGIIRLRGLGQLRKLDMGDVDLGPAELQVIGQLSHLRSLTLACDDAGLACLSGLTELEELHLSSPMGMRGGRFSFNNNTKITDAGLPHLRGFAKLRKLNLFCFDITDKGLGSLQSLTELRELDLSFTSSTPAGVASLLKSLPKLKIEPSVAGAK